MKDLLSQNNTALILYTKQESKEKPVLQKGISAKMINFFFKTEYKQSGVRIWKDGRGKPHLNKPGIHLSISNSKDITVCVLSAMKIGVDIELKRTINAHCLDFINKLYADYFEIKDLDDWVKFESSLKLKDLRLDSVSKKERITREVLNTVEYKELFLHEHYKAFVSSEQPLKTLKYKYIPQDKI